jgi:hypothetical protein
MNNRRIISLFLALLITALVVGCLNFSVQALPGHDKGMQDDRFPGEPPDDFFAGNYAIVGQKPADGTAYKGRAQIEIKDRKIRLSRTIGGRTTTVEGKFYSGGEAKKKSLQFTWKDSQGNAEMFCQYSVDFDNYARLSCMWSYGRKSQDGLPGFESYYPVAGLSKEKR